MVKAAPNPVLLVLGSALTAGAPIAAAILIRGVDAGVPALWATLAMAGGTVLLLPVAVLAPRYLLVPLAPMIMIGFGYLFFLRRDINRAAVLMLDRHPVWPVVATAVWALVLIAVGWRTRKYWIDAFRADLSRDRPKGRLRCILHRAGGVVVVAWERAVGRVWSAEEGYHGCADPYPEPGDSVIFEGRESPFGFAVDGVAAVYRDGTEICTVHS